MNNFLKIIIIIPTSNPWTIPTSKILKIFQIIINIVPKKMEKWKNILMM